MASGARKKGQEEMKKSLKDVERAMNDMMVSFGENVRRQESQEESTNVHFSTLAKMVDNLPSTFPKNQKMRCHRQELGKECTSYQS